jgi:hypothetical protein
MMVRTMAKSFGSNYRTYKLIGISLLSLILYSGVSMPENEWQTNDGITITSPKAGDFLNGNIIIKGSSEIVGFLRTELSFAYETGLPETWFVISTSDQAVQLGQLAVWDTTTISDGDYRLRLRVNLVDSTFQEIIINDLAIRNYTATETPVSSITPTFSITYETPVIEETVTPAVLPTELQPNPIALTPRQVYTSLFSGILFLLAMVVFWGIYAYFRNK